MIARQSAAAEALQALGELVLLIDLDEGWLPWCSAPALAVLAPLRVGAPLAKLCERMPGLRALLDAPPAGGNAIAAVQVDGRHFDVTMASDGGQRVALRLSDAGERERAVQRHLEDRERLLFTSRAVSVGEMASTLAHELNQPIGAIANLLRGVRMRMARETEAGVAGSEVQRAVERATEQALFASRIIARIREYTQSRQPRREAFDLGAAVRASVELLDWELQRDGVQCVLDIAPGEALVVEGDEVMLQQVFVNLVRNALDAMRGLPPGQPRTLTVRAHTQGTQAEVGIADTGCGLTDDAAAQLFVPFVSTKPTGMGIGLNICRSFVELHQGRLWFERRSPTGCSFNVALPLKETTHHDATTDAVHR
jgi:two-component system, LuxR family, sensor kinase FixL